MGKLYSAFDVVKRQVSKGAATNELNIKDVYLYLWIICYDDSLS